MNTHIQRCIQKGSVWTIVLLMIIQMVPVSLVYATEQQPYTVQVIDESKRAVANAIVELYDPLQPDQGIQKTTNQQGEVTILSTISEPNVRVMKQGVLPYDGEYQPTIIAKAAPTIAMDLELSYPAGLPAVTNVKGIIRCDELGYEQTLTLHDAVLHVDAVPVGYIYTVRITSNETKSVELDVDLRSEQGDITKQIALEEKQLASNFYFDETEVSVSLDQKTIHKQLHQGDAIASVVYEIEKVGDPAALTQNVIDPETGEITLQEAGDYRILASIRNHDLYYDKQTEYVLHVKKISDYINASPSSVEIAYDTNLKRLNDAVKAAFRNTAATDHPKPKLHFTLKNAPAYVQIEEATGAIQNASINDHFTIEVKAEENAYFEALNRSLEVTLVKGAALLSFREQGDEAGIIHKTFAHEKTYCNPLINDEGLKVTYEIDDEAYASIDEAGVVTFLKPTDDQMIQITATSEETASYLATSATYQLRIEKGTEIWKETEQKPLMLTYGMNEGKPAAKRTYTGYHPELQELAKQDADGTDIALQYYASDEHGVAIDQAIIQVDAHTGDFEVLSSGSAYLTIAYPGNAYYEAGAYTYEIQVKKKDIVVKLDASQSYGTTTDLDQLLYEQIQNAMGYDEVLSEELQKTDADGANLNRLPTIRCAADAYTRLDTPIHLDAAGSIMENYTFTTETGTLRILHDFVIPEEDSSSYYEITEMNAEGWTNQPVTIRAKEGYRLAKQERNEYGELMYPNADTRWEESIVIDTDGAFTTSYLIRELRDGSYHRISTPVQEQYNIDQRKPTDLSLILINQEHEQLPLQEDSSHTIPITVLEGHDATIQFMANDAIEGIVTSGGKEIRYTLVDLHDTVIKEGILHQLEETEMGFLAAVSLPAQFKGRIKWQAIDGAGNISDPFVSEPFVIDVEQPSTPSVQIMDEQAQEIQGGAWSNSDQLIMTLDGSEADAGIQSYEIRKKGEEAWQTLSEIKSQEATPISPQSVTSSTMTFTQEQHQVYEIRSRSNTGYTSELREVTISIDRTPVRITSYDFMPSRYIEGNQVPVEHDETYGYYFNVDTDVILHLDDGAYSSGMDEVEWYLEDTTGKKLPQKNVSINENGIAVLKVYANFKGRIYARGFDQLRNEAAFVTPEKMIIENQEQHEQSSAASIDYEKSVNVDQNGTPLYDRQVPVTLQIKDTYSGIRSVEWEITAPYDQGKNQKEIVSISENGDLHSDYHNSEENGAWTIKGRDQNMITELQKTIYVSHNSNDIVVRLTFTDRAGNVSRAEDVHLSIDQNDPVIHIAYDQNNSENGHYFKQVRTATITIEERNFDEASATKGIHIQAAGASIPGISKWKKTVNIAHPDQTRYQTQIVYQEDGDYTFDMSCVDLAKRSNQGIDSTGQIAVNAFTIDRTAPRLEVHYDNDAVMNGNYYAAPRTATLVYFEHNFSRRKAEEQILLQASDDGMPSAIPSIHWQENGDTHVATIQFQQDARYSISATYLDEAGNAIQPYEQTEFYIDQTKPTLEIQGVADGSSNQGEVKPLVTFQDTNMDIANVELTLQGANHGAMDVKGSYSDVHNGRAFQFENFEELKELDDVYTLSAIVKDKANNQEQKQITFSVNRFGSTYVLENLTARINGAYVKKEQDIIVDEINVDPLRIEDVMVRVSKDNQVSDLQKGTDYTITESPEHGSWHRYRYTLPKKNFTQEGVYRIMMMSQDQAGNISENIAEAKRGEIVFGIDKTNPNVIWSDLEGDTTYALDQKEVTFQIDDNLLLKEVQIVLNGDIALQVNEQKMKEQKDNQYSVIIPSSINKQDVTVRAIDAAGNEAVHHIEGFYVTENLWIRFYTNKALFYGSMVTLCCGGALLFLRMKKGRTTIIQE